MPLFSLQYSFLNLLKLFTIFQNYNQIFVLLVFIQDCKKVSCDIAHINTQKNQDQDFYQNYMYNSEINKKKVICNKKGEKRK